MLSEEKIKKLFQDGDYCAVVRPCDIVKFARSIEAAVLTEQAKAGPVAWVDTNGQIWGNGAAIAPGDSLFLHPAPAPEGMAQELEPAHGDVLPPIGSKVLIHLARPDAWVEHTVVGYYAWGDLGGNPVLHRVFVRVRDSEGYMNARLLKDVRPVAAAEKEQKCQS